MDCIVHGVSRTRVYLWRIHFDIWQNQYNIVKFKNKIKKKKVNLKKKKKSRTRLSDFHFPVQTPVLLVQRDSRPSPLHCCVKESLDHIF